MISFSKYKFEKWADLYINYKKILNYPVWDITDRFSGKYFYKYNTYYMFDRGYVKLFGDTI